MRIQLSAIQFDTSIQCRAAIDTALVTEYAERMTEGDDFPPVDLFGTADKAWIGDGWHRVLAAKQIGLNDIKAEVHPGGRVDALKHALGANAAHGHRRTNADKRRCVQVALAEFPKLSSRAIAELCQVGHQMVLLMRPQLDDSSSSPNTHTGLDGKSRPARRDPSPKNSEPKVVSMRERKLEPQLGPPCIGLQYARMAIIDLEQIREDDLERKAAFDLVGGWLNEHE